jgi:hypothetical protein
MRQHTNTTCEECAKPAASVPSSPKVGAFRDCKDRYDIADECMNSKSGQAKLCEQEWAAFRGCWEASRESYFRSVRTLSEAAEKVSMRER